MKLQYLRWDNEMVECLIDSLSTYKSEMVFKGLDFDADKSMQYKNEKYARLLEKSNVSFERQFRMLVSNISRKSFPAYRGNFIHMNRTCFEKFLVNRM